MPTGYTAGVQDGRIVEFREFALQCARAFGALIELRDEPLAATVPPPFEPRGYHQKALGEAQAKLAEIEAMDDRAVARAAEAAYLESCQFWAEVREKRATERVRYEAMLAKVNAWAPPTPDHQGLKDFMLSQLRESIDWDCRDYETEPPRRQTEAEWRTEALAQARNMIELHTQEHAKEVARVNDRNAWVRALAQSL